MAASLGILCAAYTSWDSLVFVIGGILTLAAWGFQKREVWLFIAVGFAFGAVHIWQTRESPSAELAYVLGQGEVFATAKGVVSSEVIPFGKKHMRFTMLMSSLLLPSSSYKPNAKILVITEKGDLPSQGDMIHATGSLKVISPPRNPGQFNAKAWMALHGVTCQMDIDAPADLVVLTKGPKISLLRMAQDCRQWMEQMLRVGIANDPLICDLLLGMVLGLTAAIPDSLQEQFRCTGTFHLFSVSGLHVGMICVLLWQAFKVLNVGRRTAVALIIPALFFYALLTGWKPSSVRAAFMSAIFLIGMIASRRPIPFNSLCAAGFFILAQTTNELFNPGFQFSFLVVAAILLLASPLRNGILRYCSPDPFIPRQLWGRWRKWIATLLLSIGTSATVSLAAWVGSLPLTIAYFHMVSLSALIANLFIVPLAFVIMTTAVMALIGGLTGGALFAAIFNNANWGFIKLLLCVVQTAAILPGSYFYVSLPEKAPIVVTVFDFGAGGAAGIETGSGVWLIDCGSAWNVRTVITPWLHSRGKTLPDGLLLTHGDARHIGGALELIQCNSQTLFIDSPLSDRSSQRKKLHHILEEFGIPKSIRRAGDLINISPYALIKILHPPAGLVGNEADDKVLVLRLDAFGQHILFLSDASDHVQQWLLENASSDIAADILIQGRPRSGRPTDLSFLNAVNPQLLISTVSTFPNNEYLDESWTASLAARGIKLLRQDQTGSVRIEIFGDGYQIEPHLKLSSPFPIE